MYAHCTVNTLLSTTYIGTIQYFLVLLQILYKQRLLQDFEPGTLIPIEQVER